MAKTAAVSVRIPAELKASLEARAKRLRRSLSAQITHDLEQLAAAESVGTKGRKLLGRYAGTKVPTEAELKAVRRQLWRGMASEKD
jgi:predicted transcriptional regulator